MPRARAAVEKVFRFNLFQSNFRSHSGKNAFYFFTFSLLTFLACYDVANAQNNTVHQSLYWLRYYNQTQVSPKYILHVEVDERRLFNPDLQSQLFVHTHLHRKFLKAVDVGAGVSYIATNSTKNNNLIVPEWRLFQEVSFTQLLFKKVQGQLRYRVDDRYIHNTSAVELIDGYNFILRHRFRLQFIMPLKKFKSGRSFILKVADEIMLNSTSNAKAFDQNRIYAGIEWQFSKKWSAELGYLNQYQSATANEYVVRDIIRYTVYHRLSLVKNN